MSPRILIKTIKVLKIILKIDNIEIIQCTIESLIEELEDYVNKSKASKKKA